MLICAAGCGRIGFGDARTATHDGAVATDGAPTLDAVPSDAAPAAIAIAHVGVWSAPASQLSRTLATSTSRQTFTFASWYKASAIAEMLMCAGISSQQQSFLWADQSDGTIVFQHQEGGSAWAGFPEAQPWPYLGVWIHLVLSVDLTQPAVDQRVRWWIDGIPHVVNSGTDPNFVQGQQLYLGDAVLHTIGNKFDGSYNWTGELAETYLIWGHALEPAAFIVGSGAATRSIAYAGPIEAESVYFDYATPGKNGLAGQPDWTATQLTASTTDLPY